MQKLIKEGEAHFNAGQFEQAERCFRDVLTHDPDNKEACNNLGVIAIQQSQPDLAHDYFIRALQTDPCYRAALINLTELCKATGQSEVVVNALENFRQRYPDDQEIKALLVDFQQEQAPQLKIAFLALPSLETFLSDIISFLETKHQVKTCFNGDKQEIESVVNWADIVWLEWANELTIALTNHPTLLNNKRVICRLHSYEAFAGFAGQIKWARIDDLIFVADHIRDWVIDQNPHLPKQVRKIHIVPNGIDLDKYTFKNREQGRNIAFLGNINYGKGPMLLLHAFQRLVAADDSYRLIIGGNFQDVRYVLYFRQMVTEMAIQKNVIIGGRVDDVPAWFEDKHYIICSSVLEGHPVGLMEAMACGLRPLIHNFVGARGIYPAKYIWNSIDDFVRLTTESHYNSQEYRDFIADNYSLQRQLHKIDQIIFSSRVTNQTEPVPQILNA